MGYYSMLAIYVYLAPSAALAKDGEKVAVLIFLVYGAFPALHFTDEISGVRAVLYIYSHWQCDVDAGRWRGAVEFVRLNNPGFQFLTDFASDF